jgi:hypothetical protein
MNKNIFYALGLALPALSLLVGCGSHVETRAERKEPTEAQKEAGRKIQQRVRSTVTDPIYDVAEAACRYKKEYGRWPSVEFSTTPESPFESFTSSTPNNKAFETAFRLKAFPSNLVMTADLIEAEDAKGNCRISLLPQSSSKKHSQFEDFLKGKSRSATNNFAFYKDRVLLGTTEDRNAFAAPFVFVELLKDVQSNPSLYRESASEKFASKGMEVILKVALCVALRVNPSQCK